MPQGKNLSRREVAEAIRRVERIVTVPHVDPDPDTLGAAVALALIAKKLGKESYVYTPDPVPFDCRFLMDFFPIEHEPPEGGWGGAGLSATRDTSSPPAEKPMTPMRRGSTPYRAALARTQRTARRRSAAASRSIA